METSYSVCLLAKDAQLRLGKPSKGLSCFFSLFPDRKYIIL